MMDHVTATGRCNMSQVVKNHLLSDSGNQTIPRKQIRGENPSEVDFFDRDSKKYKGRDTGCRRNFGSWVEHFGVRATKNRVPRDFSYEFVS